MNPQGRISGWWKKVYQVQWYFFLSPDVSVFSIFFWPQECVGHYFAYVAHLWCFRDVWIRYIWSFYYTFLSLSLSCCVVLVDLLCLLAGSNIPGSDTSFMFVQNFSSLEKPFCLFSRENTHSLQTPSAHSSNTHIHSSSYSTSSSA